MLLYHVKGLAAGAFLTVSILAPHSVSAQQKTLKDQLLGTWSVVYALDVKADGTKINQWGENPKGTMIYTSNDRYVFTVLRGDLPKITGKSRAEMSVDEAAKIARGIIVYFGRYSVNETDKTVAYTIEGSSYPNMVGVDQKRLIVSISPEELKYTNAASATGNRIEGTWKRVK